MHDAVFWGQFYVVFIYTLHHCCNAVWLSASSPTHTIVRYCLLYNFKVLWQQQLFSRQCSSEGFIWHYFENTTLILSSIFVKLRLTIPYWCFQTYLFWQVSSYYCPHITTCICVLLSFRILSIKIISEYELFCKMFLQWGLLNLCMNRKGWTVKTQL